MPYTIVQEDGILRITFSAAVTPEEVIALLREVEAIEKDANPVPNRIVTLRAVTDIQLGYVEIKPLAWKRRAERFPNSVKSAVVVSTPVQRGIARMFQTLSDNPQETLEIFDDEATAMAWLRS